MHVINRIAAHALCLRTYQYASVLFLLFVQLVSLHLYRLVRACVCVASVCIGLFVFSCHHRRHHCRHMALSLDAIRGRGMRYLIDVFSFQ